MTAMRGRNRPPSAQAAQACNQQGIGNGNTLDGGGHEPGRGHRAPRRRCPAPSPTPTAKAGKHLSAVPARPSTSPPSAGRGTTGPGSGGATAGASQGSLARPRAAELPDKVRRSKAFDSSIAADSRPFASESKSAATCPGSGSNRFITPGSVGWRIQKRNRTPPIRQLVFRPPSWLPMSGVKPAGKAVDPARTPWQPGHGPVIAVRGR